MLPMSDQQRCDSLIETAWNELTEARLSSLSEGWRLTKASKFLAQAKVRQETERFESCVEKANIARDLIAGKSD